MRIGTICMYGIAKDNVTFALLVLRPRKFSNGTLRCISALPRQPRPRTDNQTARIEALLPQGTRRRVPSATPRGHTKSN